MLGINRACDNNFICIHCENAVRELYRKCGNSVKTAQCKKCNKVIDGYVEFEPVIVLLDVVLLSEQAFRHLLYNNDFKLHWKLSLVQLLLDSFALSRKKRRDMVDVILTPEKGFYLCCMQNIADITIIASILVCSLLVLRKGATIRKVFHYLCMATKAVAIANFSKFFLLPIMVWRENTTDSGTAIHQSLVLTHHLFSLSIIYSVISGRTKKQAAFIAILAFVLKEHLKTKLSTYVEAFLIQTTNDNVAR